MFWSIAASETSLSWKAANVSKDTNRIDCQRCIACECFGANLLWSWSHFSAFLFANRNKTKCANQWHDMITEFRVTFKRLEIIGNWRWGGRGKLLSMTTTMAGWLISAASLAKAARPKKKFFKTLAKKKKKKKKRKKLKTHPLPENPIWQNWQRITERHWLVHGWTSQSDSCKKSAKKSKHRKKPQTTRLSSKSCLECVLTYQLETLLRWCRGRVFGKVAQSLVSFATNGHYLRPQAGKWSQQASQPLTFVARQFSFTLIIVNFCFIGATYSFPIRPW